MQEQNLNAHDDFFKVAFSRLDVTTDYITQFLDKNLVKKIDLQALVLSNTAYTTSDLKDYFADIVWETTYGKAKTPIKITFLFEHKSYVPRYPHLQMLRYLLEIWEDCEKNKKPLTPVIPIIVYHNKKDRHWKYKPFSNYFKGVDAGLEPYIPKFEYQLTDLTLMTEAQILGLEAGLLINALLTLHLGSKANYVVEKINTLLVNVKNVSDDEHFHQFFFAQLVYVLKNNELSPEKVNTIINNFNNTVKMNAYDVLIKNAEEKGIEKGMEKGTALTESAKDKTFATSLIVSTDFNDEKISILVGVTVDYVKQLREELIG